MCHTLSNSKNFFFWHLFNVRQIKNTFQTINNNIFQMYKVQHIYVILDTVKISLRFLSCSQTSLESHRHNRTSRVTFETKKCFFFLWQCVNQNGRVSLDQGNCANRLNRAAYGSVYVFLVISVLFEHVYRLKTRIQWAKTNTFQKKKNWIIAFLFLVVFKRQKQH